MYESNATTDRERYVVKKNELIQRSKYILTAQEQKLLSLLISKIKPEDTELYVQEFDLRYLCELFGIQVAGKNYKDLKDKLKAMRDKSFWITDPKTGKDSLCGWISSISISRSDMTVQVRLDPDLSPFLLQVKELYTMYKLKSVICLESKYAIRFYEILKSYSNIGEYTVELNDLRELLQIDGYSVYKDLREKVIDNSVLEINTKTDINVNYEPLRTGRSITHLKFTITKSKE